MTSNKKIELPEALKEKKQLGGNDTFCFGCHKDLPCFTDCCSDINIILTPLDILQLARCQGITTDEFLIKYTLTPITKELHLPMKMLKMNDDEKKLCPFVSDEGCTVYEDRPWACRMYPVGMGLPPARAGEEPEPVYVLFEDDFCKGTKEKNEWNVEDWKENQDVPKREKLEEGFSQIVSHPWFIGGRTLDPKRMQMFHTACYDLDNFRRFIFSSTFLKRFELEDNLINRLRDDDNALIEFAFTWLRYALFGEPTIKVRESAKG